MLNSHFKDILSAFNAAEVEYLIVGAYAMAAHGRPRATGDIDLWVHHDSKNSRRVWSALSEFGAPLSSVAVDDFCTPDLVFQMGLPPQRIDILTGIDGVTFSEAWPNRLEVELDDLTVPVIGLADLMRNKAASGRDKDQSDFKLLKKHHG
ncbi:MAG: hypothetical protein KDB27_17420 [Planctomycetales bacterium]|nr:hypothetical protein [Planctomycetales bacterium]